MSDSDKITMALIVECVLIDVFVAIKLLLWRFPLQYHRYVCGFFTCGNPFQLFGIDDSVGNFIMAHVCRDLATSFCPTLGKWTALCR